MHLVCIQTIALLLLSYLINYKTAGPLVGLVVVSGVHHTSGNLDGTFTLEQVDSMWRLIIGLGCVPAAAALYFRLRIPESPRFTADVLHNVQQAQRDMHNALHPRARREPENVNIGRVQAPSFSIRDFIQYFSQPQNFSLLFTTSFCWFALDVRL